MSHFASLLSERLAVVATVDPMDGATTARSSDYVNMEEFDKLLAIVLVGAITGTIDAKLEQATDSSGTDVKDVTGKAITQVADDEDNGQMLINLRADELDMDNGFTHVRLTVTPTGGTTNLLGAVILAGDPKNYPASNYDLASVAEIIS